MISYTLKCAEGHSFESWFKSAAAFDALAVQGHLSCAVCGTGSVEKALMAPAVAKHDSHPTARQGKRENPLSQPASPAEQALSALKSHVESTCDYVGTAFASEARAIHDGSARSRPIWGEARPDEARKLLQDGVSVAPLPFLPTRKSN